MAELFEARQPKDPQTIARNAGTVRFEKDYKNKRRVFVDRDDGDDPDEYLLAKGKHIAVNHGDWVDRGDPLIDGNPVPHDILRVKGVADLANYLVDEIQGVYRLQGVRIDDKHIEVICRQMLQKVGDCRAGRQHLPCGRAGGPARVRGVRGRRSHPRRGAQAGEPARGRGRRRQRREEPPRPAEADPVLQGITKASLQTQSFISAASFQETTRVLTEASVTGKKDDLMGLKENVIVGRLIPAGTGRVVQRLRTVEGIGDVERLGPRRRRGGRGPHRLRRPRRRARGVFGAVRC